MILGFCDGVSQLETTTRCGMLVYAAACWWGGIVGILGWGMPDHGIIGHGIIGHGISDCRINDTGMLSTVG